MKKNVYHNDYGLEKAELKIALKMQRELTEQTPWPDIFLRQLKKSILQPPSDNPEMEDHAH